MNYRQLGSTGLSVSEIGLGGEWLERHTKEEVYDIIKASERLGINILDCFMSEPNVRSNIGAAIKENREHWYVQGHIGSTWQDGQYVRSRDMDAVKQSFEDLLTRLQSDYVDIGMIHFVDETDEFDRIMSSEFIDYVRELKAAGRIRHIGLSTHNAAVGKLAVQCGEIEVIMFSINPAFDMMPINQDLDTLFSNEFDQSLDGIDPARTEFYSMCEQNGVGITVMKCYCGGRLLSAEHSQLKVALTPMQCLHYALTKPAVSSVMVGVDTPEHIEEAARYSDAGMDEKDYATVLASAPMRAYTPGQCTYCGHCAPCPMGIDIAMVNKLYDLAATQPEAPATLKAHYAQLSAKGADCVACGSCESRCPFGVKVSERMSKADKLLG